MEQLLESIESIESKDIQCFTEQLQDMLKPYQQEHGRRQKKMDFLKQCVNRIEKNDFFYLDELLSSKQATDVVEDAHFNLCDAIFCELRKLTETQIDNYRLKFKSTLLQLAEEANLPLDIDLPRFSVLKGIEGKIDFSTRRTTLNQIVIKSIDPKRIISAAVKLKQHLYDSPFEPQAFIDSLLQCYKEILKKESRGTGDVVPIYQLYTDYVWSLQSKAFFQNMEKGKFKGYSVEQFAVDLWRFFQSPISTAEGGYRIRLNAGRGKSFWLIDQDGEKRQITHALFIKN
ncbi:MAG: hypothetical protein A3F67_11220 [Verrucomicrobia bacterium RIFCSPHIGHO2_12_FULL_41_10]|nr:MAG: hypothetical protein A3F67_11220 [Verrucomicrobia bacterium RIFCSPHIGHO2_12_FULL_41_10]